MSDKSPRAEREEKILQFWKENDIFKKTLEKESPKGDFIFYEGPPTANGRPGIHHIESRAFKDAVPRYKTMQGYRVPRKAGWDTHGLPVELEIEKTLELKSKKEIENFGVAEFNKACKESVGKYIDEWSKFTDRIGYWVNQEEAYYTYHNSYIESVWSVFSHVDKKGLLYKDYKVVPWCPRCGTALSSHELAQGYQDVKDLSVTVKFKVKGHDNTFILAWTTTAWTLPGNVALAVGADIEYVILEKEGERFILAKDRVEANFGQEGFEIIEEKKGSELVGLAYEPLYPYLRDAYESDPPAGGFEKAYRVYIADFVNTLDGTGVVHTAVMYGQDDFELGTKIGLPKHHLVDEGGHFMNEAGFLAGKFVRDEETAVEIIKDLAPRNLLFKKEKYDHSYPHCWRCKTPLIYYARDSWYIAMSKLRNELLKENEKINWEPDYIKEGRFGEWLREVKDWAISRERYWGTPMPVWESSSGKRIVVDSVDTLKKYVKNSGNKYFVMRHGGTEGNLKEIVSYNKEGSDHLTKEGKEQSASTAEKLKGKNIDLIVTSPFLRTRETAEIVRTALGLPEDAIVVDERLKEINPGEFDGKDWDDYHEHTYNAGPEWFTAHIPGGESLQEVGKRVGESLYDIEATYQGKNILIVTHGGPAWLLYVCSGLYTPERNARYRKADTHVFIDEFKRFNNGEARELPFKPLPHDENFTLDLHKPYIDEVVLEKDGEEYRRVKEVMDVWMDSGAMPFAQDSKNVLFPADFISEAIDQTRGWFYTLHAVGVLMDRGHAYKNVICLGHILDKEGKKMSKSVGNVVNPWEMIDKYGVDTLRLWMYSVNQPGESKNFDERSVDEIQKRIFNLLDNVYSFYELYRDRELETEILNIQSKSVLDIWILCRLIELTEKMTINLDNYKLLEPVRELRDFIDDLSTWYLRRSRERIKLGDPDAKKRLYFILRRLTNVMAPFAPFAAEDLYQKLRMEEDPASVHLTKWPINDSKPENVDEILSNMKETRRLVSVALEQRSKANIKVRQPLSKLEVKKLEVGKEFLVLIQEEVNVKEIIENPTLDAEVALDTTLTPELEEEGRMREEIRMIQDMRKEKGLKPGEKIKIDIPPGKEGLYQKFKNEIQSVTNIEF